MNNDLIVVLDYGSQTAQLIARRVREAGVYCVLYPWSTPRSVIEDLNPKGIILSGGPSSVYEADAPTLPDYVLQLKIPILAICYGMQVLTHCLGGKVAAAQAREYGLAQIQIDQKSRLYAGLPQQLDVWMSHGDRIDEAPRSFAVTASSENSPITSMSDGSRGLYAVQFHPEVQHTPLGAQILSNFVLDICNCEANWIPGNIIESIINDVREQVGNGHVLLALSGGVDSSVVAELIRRSVGEQLTCVFVDTGLLRKNEAQQVIKTFHETMGSRFIAVNAVEDFLSTLEDTADPEIKRQRIGEMFVRIFEREAKRLEAEWGSIDFLAQGTIYPDVIESAGIHKPHAEHIKTHHNVGGLPDDMQFDLVEPLRNLFKDEVRKIGVTLGLPDAIVWRQPFPGPGLAIRCIGQITFERLNILREVDAIFIEELNAAGLLRDQTAQAFAVLLPVKSVGVMGDKRTYAQTVVLRAVQTDDFMTADWARLPFELLGKISSRIVNEVPQVNRVVYDITSKPPATIEWE